MNRDLRPSIMRNQEWDSTTAELDTLDLAELVLGLLVLDAVDGEAALGVVDEAEVLASLLDGDDVHEAGGVGDVGADLAVNLNEALHHDGLGLAVVEGILQPVADEDDQGHAVPELVRTGRGTGGVDTREFVEQPVRRRAEALLVLLSMKIGQSRVGRVWLSAVREPAKRAITLETSGRSREISIRVITYGPLPILTECDVQR